MGVNILCSAELDGIDVSIRVEPPTEGRCVTHKLNSHPWQRNFTCMGYHHAVPWLGTFENPKWSSPKAELVVVNLHTMARYPLGDGIPSRVPFSHNTTNYQLRL